jgi:multidrug transporter EmrE-like cation transporter
VLRGYCLSAAYCIWFGYGTVVVVVICIKWGFVHFMVGSDLDCLIADR